MRDYPLNVWEVQGETNEPTHGYIPESKESKIQVGAEPLTTIYVISKIL